MTTTDHISVEVQDEAVQALLRRLQASVTDLSPAMQDIGARLLSQVNIGFRDARDPWGNAWKPLKHPRKRNKAGGDRGRPLSDTGRLRNSFSSRADATSVTVGTNTRYAAIHQFGGTVEHAARSIRVRLRTVKNANGKNVTRFAKDSYKRGRAVWGTANAWSTTVPARPMLPIRGARAELPAVWQRHVIGVLQRHLDRALR